MDRHKRRCQPSRTSEPLSIQKHKRGQQTSAGCSRPFQKPATLRLPRLPLVTPSTSSAGGDSSATPAARNSRPTDREYCSKRCIVATRCHATRDRAFRQAPQTEKPLDTDGRSYEVGATNSRETRPPW